MQNELATLSVVFLRCLQSAMGGLPQFDFGLFGFFAIGCDGSDAAHSREAILSVIVG